MEVNNPCTKYEYSKLFKNRSCASHDISDMFVVSLVGIVKIVFSPTQHTDVHTASHSVTHISLSSGDPNNIFFH